MKKTIAIFVTCLLLIGMNHSLQAQDASADSDAAALAKETANPLANMISLPVQFNFNFGLGEYNRTQTLINLMPVIPYPLGKKLNVINRIILPVLIQPDVAEESGSTFGIGDINYSMFFTPQPKQGN